MLKSKTGKTTNKAKLKWAKILDKKYLFSYKIPQEVNGTYD